MTPELIQRYQPGGDLFASYDKLYGTNGASLIALAALGGDRLAITNAIARVKFGERLDESTFRAFVGQLATDPLGAPLDSLNSGLSKLAGNTAVAFLRNPMVLLVLALIAAGVFVNFFGLPKFLKK